MSELIQCKKCILDSDDDPNLDLDLNGECQYCRYYKTLIRGLGSLKNRKSWLKNKVEEIKLAGKKNQFDCILGISGGVDSSYMALWAHRNGLRPLLVHLDNGWNSELAVKNIETICTKLKFDLHTHVIEWQEFKSLQLAYLRASVVDIEVLTDHAISAVMSKLANKYKIKYALSGFNYSTEAIMPKGWTFDKCDWANIKDISQKYGDGVKIRTYPYLSFSKKLKNHFLNKMETVNVLNYMDFNQENIIEELKSELNWREYHVKHGESIFTKFYQQYILPRKFHVDKRKAHLSNLICSGQINKEDALNMLSKKICEENEIQEEKEYVTKKFGLSQSEFDSIMSDPVRKHAEFKTESEKWNSYFNFIGFLKKMINLNSGHKYPNI